MKSSSETVIFLEGRRLFLRPLQARDAERCRRWIHDPETRRFLLNQWPVMENGERDWIEHSIKGNPPTDIALAIALKRGRRHIGNIGLHKIDWRNRNAETGMLIGDSSDWGKGYGHEAKELLLEYAFDTLGLHRINSCANASNARSIACMKKSGYLVEGRRRQVHLTAGRWEDEVLLGLLAADWCKSRHR